MFAYLRLAGVTIAKRPTITKSASRKRGEGTAARKRSRDNQQATPPWAGAPQRLHARLRPQFKKLELDDDIVQSMTLREKISPRKIFIGVSP